MLVIAMLTAPTSTEDGARDPATGPLIAVVVPVYNEQGSLEPSIRRLHRFLDEQLPFAWRIVIADNASTDATPAIAAALALELPHTEVLRLAAKGRGRALRAAWSRSDADVRCYMDVDLSTDLRALLPLIAGLISGHSDLAIGTRLAPGSRVVRGPKRELISRSYNRLLRILLRARFSDAQCGFKAISAHAARTLLPQVRDDAWFFDTELLVLAQRQGLRIHEVAVDWVDDPASSVEIVPTALADLRGVARLVLRQGSRASRSSGSPRRSPMPRCTCCCARRWPRYGPTGSRWRSRPSPTRRPTASSRSTCAAPTGCSPSMPLDWRHSRWRWR